MPREGHRVVEEKARGIAPRQVYLFFCQAVCFWVLQGIFERGKVRIPGLGVVGETAITVMRLSSHDDGYTAHGHFHAHGGGVHQPQVGNLHQVIGVDRVASLHQVNVFWHFRQGGTHHFGDRWAFGVFFARVNTHHELRLRPLDKSPYRALQPFGHALGKHLPPQRQTVTNHIGGQQHHRAGIQPQGGAGARSTLRGDTLPAAGEVLPQRTFLPGSEQFAHTPGFRVRQGSIAQRSPQVIRFLPHHFGVLRKPDAAALLAEFIGHGVNAQVARHPVHCPKFQDAAIGNDDHIRAAVSQVGPCGLRRVQVALPAQAVEGALRVHVLHLEGVLHILHGQGFQVGKQCRGQGRLNRTSKRNHLHQRLRGLQDTTSIGFLSAQVEFLQRFLPARVRQICQGHLVT